MNREKDVADHLLAHRRLLIIAHAGPDGDTLGSALALSDLLSQMGHEAQVVCHDPVPPTLNFLPGADRVVSWNQVRPDEWEGLVAVDCGSPSRMAWPQDSGWERLSLLNVDHHAHNPEFGTVNWIDANAAATGEMITRLAFGAGWPVTPEIAMCLYTAISTDTLSFRQVNTTPQTLAWAARLAERGLNLASLNQLLWEHQKAGEVRLLGWALSHMNLSRDHRVAWLEVTRAIMDAFGVHDATVDTLVHHLRAIDSVQVAVVTKEMDRPGWVKISWRGKQDIDVSQYATQFGGGGHRYAAAAQVAGSITEVTRQVLQVIGVGPV